MYIPKFRLANIDLLYLKNIILASGNTPILPNGYPNKNYRILIFLEEYLNK
jgi:hypothetical protein